MDKAQFNIIMSALEARKTLCKTYLGGIRTTDDLSLLTLARAADLKSFCISEETIMTNIVMVDLYHVIGMGDLTPPQMMKFTYAIQEYLEYRPTIKALAAHLNSITSLPKIPVKTQYKLQGLGGVLLTKGEGPLVVEESSTSTQATGVADLPFSIDGRTIRVDLKQLEFFASIASTITKVAISVDTLRQKMSGLKEYFGINWTEVTASEAVGVLKSNDMYSRFVSYYNKRKMDCQGCT